MESLMCGVVPVFDARGRTGTAKSAGGSLQKNVFALSRSDQFTVSSIWFSDKDVSTILFTGCDMALQIPHQLHFNIVLC